MTKRTVRQLGYLGSMSWCVTSPSVYVTQVLSLKTTTTPQNGLAQIFGGLVAYGISFEKSHRLTPYKIVFLLLGAMAIVVGICVLLWMPDSPVHAHMLTREERIAALERVRNDQGGTENKIFKKDQVYEALTDIRTWLVVLTTLLTSIPNGGLSNFSNLIIKSFGYTYAMN
jgi:ACS family allantoate permease-like MFS transporter